jgi:hypothetical protein
VAAVTGKRVPIGGQPEPRRLFGQVWLCSHLPQDAWLEGSVLIVEDNWGAVGKCDLTSAVKIAIHTAPFAGSFHVLYVRQGPGTPPVHLVLEGPGWFLVSAEHLRMLAQIISSRPGEPSRKIKKVMERLREMARYQDYRNAPIDWSFRTDPKGRNRSSGKTDLG